MCSDGVALKFRAFVARLALFGRVMPFFLDRLLCGVKAAGRAAVCFTIMQTYVCVVPQNNESGSSAGSSTGAIRATVYLA